ncbi:NAD(P)-binding protein [Teratosphaeria nubilosa]|uniref:NAD(P)-binding protein n=1 Tax=Teratosphaeria nubilosa TaxID=161662 RepID=A0A6G1LDR3_9PEZI|nr:NAD(P)-binding protein [Teratosphaeria nubilosa]
MSTPALPPPPPTPRTILITGATGGIGRATAIAFAKTGEYNLALHYNSASNEVISNLGQELLAAAPSPSSCSTQVQFFRANLGDFDQVRALHKDVLSKFSKIDILFNNAGTTGGVSGVQNLSDTPISLFESTWRINTGSGILLTQLCLPAMEAKSAVHGFVHWLAGSVARKGVTVNAVAPAVVRGTGMMGDDEGRLAGIAEKLPVGRLGMPEEIANTVMWMVDTGYVTNKVITVDGGMYPY